MLRKRWCWKNRFTDNNKSWTGAETNLKCSVFIIYDIISESDIIYMFIIFLLRSVTMSTFRDWEAYKRLKDRADTNSVVDVLKNNSTGDLIVRKETVM